MISCPAGGMSGGMSSHSRSLDYKSSKSTWSALFKVLSNGDCCDKCNSPDEGLKNISPLMFSVRMLAPNLESPHIFCTSFHKNITIKLAILRQLSN